MTGSDEPGADSPLWTLRVSLVGLPKSPAPHDLASNWSSGLASGRGGFQLRPGKQKRAKTGERGWGGSSGRRNRLKLLTFDQFGIVLLETTAHEAA